MFIEVISRCGGGVAKSMDKVHAPNFAEAVAMVFRNRAMYRRVEQIGKNNWTVELSSITNKITRLHVRCVRLEEKT